MTYKKLMDHLLSIHGDVDDTYTPVGALIAHIKYHATELQKEEGDLNVILETP